MPTDLDKLAREFKRIAPEDGGLIDRLVRDARRCAPLEPPLENPLELMNAFEKTKLGLRYLPMVPIIFRYKNLPITAYVARYKNQMLREALQLIVGNEDMSALVLVMLLAFRTRNNTGFVAGGSWDFAMAIADRYTRLGGTVRFNTRVTSVKVENNRATGVQCADGTFVPAATVVSCADGHTTIFKMLDGRFVDRKIRYLYEHCQTFPAIVQVSLGIKKVFPDAPHTLNLPLRQPLRVDDQTQIRPAGGRDVRRRIRTLPGRHHGHDGADADQLRVLDRPEKKRSPRVTARKRNASSRKSSPSSTKDFPDWRRRSSVPTSRRPPPLCATPATGRAVTKAGCRRRAFWAGAFLTRCRG